MERVTSLVEELTAQRAEDRIGTEMLVLVDANEQTESGGSEHGSRRCSAAARTRHPMSTATS